MNKNTALPLRCSPLGRNKNAKANSIHLKLAASGLLLSTVKNVFAMPGLAGFTGQPWQPYHLGAADLLGYIPKPIIIKNKTHEMSPECFVAPAGMKSIWTGPCE